MLGIAVNIWRPIDPPDTPARTRRGFIGEWEAAGVGMVALEWLERLVAEGRATSLGGNGYPYTYKISASSLAEALRAGAPNIRPGKSVIVGEDYITRDGTVTGFEIDWDALGECPPEEELFVEAWDLS
jgi:hypothetical protein